MRKFTNLFSLNKSNFIVEIPPNVQRCCTRCYDKLINEIRKRKVNQPLEEDDDDNEESAITVHQKQDEGTNELHKKNFS